MFYKIVKQLENIHSFDRSVIQEVVNAFNGNYDYSDQYLTLMRDSFTDHPAEVWEEWCNENILDFKIYENYFSYA